jgi:hypothetical protein
MRVHLVHWNPVEAREHAAALTALGHRVTYLPEVTGTPLMRALRSGDAEVFLIDLSRRPSHGREVGMALRSSPATRHRPIVFAGGDPEAVAHLRGLLPDAVFTTWGRVKTALPRALTRQPAAPIVPPDALYAGRSLGQKLGLAAGEIVAVVNGPTGVAGLLAPLPAGARLTAAPSATAHRFLWFVRSRKDLHQALGTLEALVTTQVAWLAWPKTASGVTTDLNGNTVREAALASGFVDFKICSVDATWSGLALKRRRR